MLFAVTTRMRRPFAALDELRHQDACLQGLAKTDGIGDEDSLARLGERLLRRNELVRQGVHGGLVADMNPRISRRCGAQQTLDKQVRFCCSCRGVGNETGSHWIDRRDCVQIIKERGRHVPYQSGDAGTA